MVFFRFDAFNQMAQATGSHHLIFLLIFFISLLDSGSFKKKK